MRNITIIRRSFLSVSVMATILSSMGLCWQSNLDCQYGKWLACAIVFFATFIALLGDKINENKCLCFLIFILIGCLISDIHANSVSLSNLTWGFALLSFFVLCQGITSKRVDWHCDDMQSDRFSTHHTAGHWRLHAFSTSAL